MTVSEKGFQVNFKAVIKQKLLPSSLNRIAVLPTTEYEGIFRNGGVGTYYKNLAQRLTAQGWDVILIVADFESEYRGESHLPEIKHIFSPSQAKYCLNLTNDHYLMLEQLESNWRDFLSVTCWFYLEAIVRYFLSAKIYVEFHEMLGIGYRAIQAKKAGLLPQHCVIATTMHSGHEWIYEANEKYQVEYVEWLWQTINNEQFCFEEVDLAFFPSSYLTTRVTDYGWNIDHAFKMPNYVPIVSLK
jgi:hypothetical protein